MGLLENAALQPFPLGAVLPLAIGRLRVELPLADLTHQVIEHLRSQPRVI